MECNYEGENDVHTVLLFLKFKSARKERIGCTELLHKRCMGSSTHGVVLIITALNIRNRTMLFSQA